MIVDRQEIIQAITDIVQGELCELSGTKERREWANDVAKRIINKVEKELWWRLDESDNPFIE